MRIMNKVKKLEMLTAGAGLRAQKGFNPILLQFSRVSPSKDLVISLRSLSSRHDELYRKGSFTSPVYVHIKPGRRLKGMIHQLTQHQTKSTPVNLFPSSALTFENVGINLAHSVVVSRSGRGCLGLSRGRLGLSRGCLRQGRGLLGLGRVVGLD